MPAARRTQPTKELTGKLLQLLEAQRSQGSSVYPLTLTRLLQLAQDLASPEQLAKIVRSKAFKQHLALAKLSRTDCLVALANDRPLLAADARLLESALAAATPKKPAAQPLARIAPKVPAELRSLFAESVERRVREQTLPARIEVLQSQGTVRLYLRDRPPEEVAATELSIHLVQTLRDLRSQGPYPIALGGLLALAAGTASSSVLKKALAAEAFQQVLRAVPRHADTPVALAEDAERLADSPLLLEFLLSTASKPAVKAFPLKDLKKSLVESLRQPFVAAVSWRVEQGKLPPNIGWLWIKTRHLFFTKDVQGSIETARAEPVHQESDDGAAGFADQFAATFEQLDRAAGGRNFVSLVELRRALPMPRAIFDAELFRLRQGRRFSLSVAEGRHGISAEEREAGIPEEGSLLLFVSRIDP